jgi:hypothetical protein
VRAEPLAEAARLVASLPEVDQVTQVDGLLDVTVDTSRASQINRVLVDAGIAVAELYAQRTSLEDVFLELTAREEDRK